MMKLTGLKPASKSKINTTVSFDLHSIYQGHHHITYKGVPYLKCPFDYVMYQMLISEVRPELVIEIGTNEGGGALYLADLLEAAGGGEVHTIDIDNRSSAVAKANPRIKFFHKGWQAYDLALAAPFKKVLVIEDSSHEYKNTLGAIEKFAPLVSLDSYLIVEDGVVDALGFGKKFGGGPVKAIQQFLPAHPEFILDTRWTNMFGQNATFNTIGYLKKVKG